VSLPGEEKNRSALETILQWCRDWIRTDPLAEVSRSGGDEFERIARDLRVSPTELRALVSRGEGACDLLLRRMAVLDLDQHEVCQIAPETFRDLQRVCAICENHRRCARDLARDSADPAWEDYCPNAATLMALDALPWASRREW
jgi:hypothetical protein